MANTVVINNKEYEIKTMTVSGVVIRYVEAIHAYMPKDRGWFQTDAKNKKIITAHHTASRATGSVDNILRDLFNTHHGKNDWPHIAYAWVYIPEHKLFVQLNTYEDVTWHDSINWDSIGFAIKIYAHQPYNEQLDNEDKVLVRAFLDFICEENPTFPADHNDVFGHGERSPTVCPGDLLRALFVEYRNTLGNPTWGNPEAQSDKDTERMVSRWKEIVEYFGFDDYFVSPSWIKDIVKDLEKKISRLESYIKNVTDMEVEGVDGETRKVSWYVTEAFNRGDQVKRLKDENTLLLKSVEKSSTEHAQVIEEYQELLKNKGIELGTMAEKYAELQKKLRECAGTVVIEPTYTLVELVVKILEKLTGGKKNAV